MARQKDAGDPMIEKATQADADAQVATDQAKAGAEMQATAADAPRTPLSWKPHEEVPSQGGSFVRQPDGSLTKANPADEGEA